MVNPLVRLYQNSPKAELHIYTYVARELTGFTFVAGVNSWEELV